MLFSPWDIPILYRFVNDNDDDDDNNSNNDKNDNNNNNNNIDNIKSNLVTVTIMRIIIVIIIVIAVLSQSRQCTSVFSNRLKIDLCSPHVSLNLKRQLSDQLIECKVENAKCPNENVAQMLHWKYGHSERFNTPPLCVRQDGTILIGPNCL